MSEITIVNLRSCKDFGSLTGDVRIDRATVFGNPFPIGTCLENDEKKSYTRAQCIARYAKYITDCDVVIVDGKRYDGLKVRKAIRVLAEQGTVTRLGCWCFPAQCHGEIIINLIRDYERGIEMTERLNENICSNPSVCHDIDCYDCDQRPNPRG